MNKSLRMMKAETSSQQFRQEESIRPAQKPGRSHAPASSPSVVTSAHTRAGKGTSSNSGSGRGAPKGNRNAAKIGEDLSWQMYLSKLRRGLFEEWFELRFGRPALSEDELRETARTIANNALNSLMAQDFERIAPGRISGSKGEVF